MTTLEIILLVVVFLLYWEMIIAATMKHHIEEETSKGVLFGIFLILIPLSFLMLPFKLIGGLWRISCFISYLFLGYDWIGRMRKDNSKGD